MKFLDSFLLTRMTCWVIGKETTEQLFIMLHLRNRLGKKQDKHCIELALYIFFVSTYSETGIFFEAFV